MKRAAAMITNACELVDDEAGDAVGKCRAPACTPTCPCGQMVFCDVVAAAPPTRSKRLRGARALSAR